MPENLQERWINTAKSQSADLTHLMSNGYFIGVKLGFNPEQFKKILVVELEYNYQKYNVERITSPGFIAGIDTIPAFSSKAEVILLHFLPLAVVINTMLLNRQ